MAKYLRHGQWQDVAAGTTGGAVADTNRSGLSILTVSGTVAEVFALEAPVTGAEKYIVCTSTSTAGACTVRGSTATSVTLGAAAETQINFTAASTERQVVHLLGLSSTHWAVVSMYPVASTGAGPTIGTS